MKYLFLDIRAVSEIAANALNKFRKTLEPGGFPARIKKEKEE